MFRGEYMNAFESTICMKPNSLSVPVLTPSAEVSSGKLRPETFSFKSRLKSKMQEDVDYNAYVGVIEAWKFK